jgi:hypothetical protein
MFRFIRKVCIFLLPLFVLLALYFVLDPFKVIHYYSNYYNLDEAGRVGINRDYVSTSTFINNSKNYDYNSFIFGNSRSMSYEIDDWKKYIEPTSLCYHFDASGEAIYGIYKKLMFIDKSGNNIKNALIILDYDTLSKVASNSGHLFIISPQMENNANILLFHFTFIKAFYNPQFMMAFLDYKISGKIKAYMTRSNLLDDRPLHYDIMTNEITRPFFEEQIERGEYYTQERMEVFYQREGKEEESPVIIHSEQKRMLIEMKSIFDKHHSNYKIIINPLYDQKKLNEKDLEYLNTIFGTRNVFDFSGINEFTNNYSNYYEDSHYRPIVSKKILELIYEY